MYSKARDYRVTKWLGDRAAVLAAISFCAWHSRHLWTTAWIHSPFDSYASVAFLIWCIPAFTDFLQRIVRPNVLFVGISIAFTVMSQVCEIRSFAYVGLAFAISSGRTNGRLTWLCSSISWMPALGWMSSQTLPEYTVLIRLSLACVGAASAFVTLRRKSQAESNHVAARGRCDSNEQLMPVSTRMAGVFIVIIAAITWDRFPIPDALRDLEEIPIRGIGFEGKDVPLTERERDNLSGANVLKRIYRVNGQRFLMTVTDGTRNRHAVHDPTYCFRGDGWHVEHSFQVPLYAGAARLVKLRRHDRHTEAVFWYSDGRTRHSSIVRYWFQTTVRRLTLGVFRPEPVLVLLRPIGHETVDWGPLFNELPMLGEI